MLLAYLFTRLEDLKMLVSMVALIGIFPIGLGIVGYMLETLEDKQYKIFKFCITVWVSSILVWVATPTTKEAAFIWIAPQIVENGAVKETVKNIPELTRLGTEYLKNVLKEKVEGQNGTVS